MGRRCRGPALIQLVCEDPPRGPPVEGRDRKGVAWSALMRADVSMMLNLREIGADNCIIVGLQPFKGMSQYYH